VPAGWLQPPLTRGCIRCLVAASSSRGPHRPRRHLARLICGLAGGGGMPAGSGACVAERVREGLWGFEDSDHFLFGATRVSKRSAERMNELRNGGRSHSNTHSLPCSTLARERGGRNSLLAAPMPPTSVGASSATPSRAGGASHQCRQLPCHPRLAVLPWGIRTPPPVAGHKCAAMQVVAMHLGPGCLPPP